jgi:hypothetical protein
MYSFLIFFILIMSLINAFYILYSPSVNIFLKLISFILIFVVIYIGSFKETYLPFLHASVFPFPLIPSSNLYPPSSNLSIPLDFDYPDGSKVIYWASKPNDKNQTYNNPYDAYGNYTNSGVAIVNNKKAVLYLNSPEKYKVPSGITLDRHIHYRVAVPNNPFLTKVKTIFI